MKEIATVLPKNGMNVHASVDPVSGPGVTIGTLSKGQQVQVYGRKDTAHFRWREIVYHGQIRGWVAECRKDGKEVFLQVEQQPDPKMPPPVDYHHDDDSSPLGSQTEEDWHSAAPSLAPEVSWWFVGGVVVVALVVMALALFAVR